MQTHHFICISDCLTGWVDKKNTTSSRNFFLESILILKRKKIEIFFQRGIEEIEVHIIKYGSYLVGLKKRWNKEANFIF
jgi:hypothetical protein